MKIYPLFFLTFLLFLSHSDAKVIQQKMGRSLMRGDTWHIITKFVMAPGQGTYDFTIWNKSPKKDSNQVIPMTLHVYTMDSWKQQSQVSTCSEKQGFSNSHQNFNFPLKGSVVTLPQASLNQEEIQIYYFVLSSCGDSYNHIMLQSNPIMYELNIKNSDGSHVSQEENGIITVLVIALIPIVAFLLINSVKIIQFYSSKAALDYPLVMLLVALILEAMALTSEFLHLYTYSANGKGFFMFDWASAVFSNLSQFVISLLFLLMATGWTVKAFNKKEEDLFVIVGTLAGILITVIAITGKISRNDIDSFHDYENWSGLVSLFVKLVLYFLFGNQVLNNYEKSDKKLKRHFAKLGIFGSIYLLSFPLTVIASDFLLPIHLRHKATTYVTIIAQTATLLIYASLLSFKEGEYYPIVYKSRTILPLNKVT